MNNLSRRELIRNSLFAAAATSFPFIAQTARGAGEGTTVQPAATSTSATSTPVAIADPSATAGAPFVLPPLPYDYAALEPYIDTETMKVHHDKHHAAYVKKLNEAVTATPSLAGKSVEELIGNLNKVPESVRTAVRNNGGGHANHSLFWLTMAPNQGPRIKNSALTAKLAEIYGSMDKFQEQFAKSATTVFGSGWAWLTLDATRKLKIETLPNQDSPLMSGKKPLFGLDIWEHAYYLKHENRRPEYIDAFWKVINWDFVSDRYDKWMA